MLSVTLTDTYPPKSRSRSRSRLPHQMEIRIWDRGSVFDLEDFIEKNAYHDYSFSGHGQGLPILQKIADQLSYTRSEDQRNCLLIIKQFSRHESDRTPSFS